MARRSEKCAEPAAVVSLHVVKNGGSAIPYIHLTLHTPSLANDRNNHHPFICLTSPICSRMSGQFLISVPLLSAWLNPMEWYLKLTVAAAAGNDNEDQVADKEEVHSHTSNDSRGWAWLANMVA